MALSNAPVHAMSDEAEQIEELRKQLERIGACAWDASENEQCEPMLVDPESGIQVQVPRPLLQILVRATEVLAAGGAVAVMPYHAKMTTQEAADYLGVSRPYFISLLDEGVIPYERLRSHRRILLSDVQAYRKHRDAERRELLAEMARESFRRGFYDLPEEVDLSDLGIEE